jgi:hypothetical protein
MPIGGVAVPAHTILADFEQAKRDITANPMLGALWGQRFAGLPPGFLNLCQQTIDLSKEKVEKWLAEYMFKGENPEKAPTCNSAELKGTPHPPIPQYPSGFFARYCW